MTRRRSCLILLFLLLVSGGAFFVFKPREPLLLNQATRIADASNWDFRWTTYHWINDHEVLYFAETVPDDADTEDDEETDEAGFLFCKHDILTGRDTYLATLTRLAQNSFSKRSYTLISPDGKRICWTGEGSWGTIKGRKKAASPPPREDSIWIATLEGKEPQVWERGRYSWLGWMADSTHLVEYPIDGGTNRVLCGTVYDIQSHTPLQRLSLLADKPNKMIASNNHLLATEPTSRPETESNTAVIYAADLNRKTQTSQRYLIRLPFPAEIWDECFAPQGDKIVWPLVQKDSLPPIYGWLHRHISAFNPPRAPKLSLWVSRIDGSDMHEIGSLALKSSPYGGVDSRDMPRDISWNPDGKRISFLYHDGLYAVPVK